MSKIVNAFDAPAPDSSCGRMWYLGRSIQAMDKADFVIFHKRYFEAKGCQVEMAGAARYFQNKACASNDRTITPLISDIYFNKMTKEDV